MEIKFELPKPVAIPQPKVGEIWYDGQETAYLRISDEAGRTLLSFAPKDSNVYFSIELGTGRVVYSYSVTKRFIVKELVCKF